MITMFDFSKAEQAGAEAVDESEMDLDSLVATLQPGHDAWSESAIGAGVHTMLGCPNDDESRQEFYRAYDRGAVARIRALAERS